MITQEDINIKQDMLKMMDKLDKIEQMIINVDAKYRIKIKECCKKVSHRGKDIKKYNH